MNTRAPNPTDWLQFYESTLTDQAFQGSPVSDDSVSALTAPSLASTGTGTTSSPSGHLSPDGRVSKPARRRRASRTAPTTLVNTDTTNFRAMVQQFTGVTNPSLAFGPPSDSQNISFRGLGSQGIAANMSAPLHGYRQSYQQGYGDGYGTGFGGAVRPNNDAASGGYFIRNPNPSSNSPPQMFPSTTSSSSNYRSNGFIQ